MDGTVDSFAIVFCLAMTWLYIGGGETRSLLIVCLLLIAGVSIVLAMIEEHLR